MEKNVENYIKKIENFGFKKVLEIPFQVKIEPDHIKDTFYVFFHENYGIVLTFDTYYNGGSVNGGNYYFEWEPKKQEDYFRDLLVYCFSKYSPEQADLISEYVSQDPWYMPGCSGGVETVGSHKIWVGDHDCRDSCGEITGRINYLAEQGTFLQKWISRSDIFRPKFVHWGDHQTHFSAPWDEGYKMYCDAVKNQGRDRYAMLPEKVKNAICVAYAGEPPEYKPIFCNK
jgi:hypothetical protein